MEVDINPYALMPYRAAMDMAWQAIHYVKLNVSNQRLGTALRHLAEWQMNAAEVGLPMALCGIQEGSPLYVAVMASHNMGMMLIRRWHGQFFFWLAGGKGLWDGQWEATQN